MLGARVGARVQRGDIICLQGELGAGKTTFTQGLGRGLGIADVIHSPTFILANEHRGGRVPLYHLDLYRVASAAEAIGFGLDDYLAGEGVCVIEWAEKILTALPRECLWITFQHHGENARKFIFDARGARYEELIQIVIASRETAKQSPSNSDAYAASSPQNDSSQ